MTIKTIIGMAEVALAAPFDKNQHTEPTHDMKTPMKQALVLASSGWLLAGTAAAAPDPIKIAQVNTIEVREHFGFQEFQALAYPKKDRQVLAKLAIEEKKAKVKIVNADSPEELQAAQQAVGFLHQKANAIRSMRQNHPNKVDQQLSDLIAKEFSGEYPVIIASGNAATHLDHLVRNAIHSNLELVDITDEVIKLVAKELGFGAPEPEEK